MTVREVLAAAIPPDAWAWAAIILGAWLLLAATGTAGYSRFAGKLKRLRSSRVRRPQYPPPVPPVAVNWIEVPPPVPLPTTRRADVDATWLDPWPVDLATAPLQQVKRLFDDLIALEGLQ